MGWGWGYEGFHGYGYGAGGYPSPHNEKQRYYDHFKRRTMNVWRPPR